MVIDKNTYKFYDRVNDLIHNNRKQFLERSKRNLSSKDLYLAEWKEVQEFFEENETAIIARMILKISSTWTDRRILAYFRKSLYNAAKDWQTKRVTKVRTIDMSSYLDGMSEVEIENFERDINSRTDWDCFNTVSPFDNEIFNDKFESMTDSEQKYISIEVNNEVPSSKEAHKKYGQRFELRLKENYPPSENDYQGEVGGYNKYRAKLRKERRKILGIALESDYDAEPNRFK